MGLEQITAGKRLFRVHLGAFWGGSVSGGDAGVWISKWIDESANWARHCSAERRNPAIIWKRAAGPPPPPSRHRAGGECIQRARRDPCAGSRSWINDSGRPSRPSVNMFAVWSLMFGGRNPRLPEKHTQNSLRPSRSESDCIIKHSWKLPS